MSLVRHRRRVTVSYTVGLYELGVSLGNDIIYCSLFFQSRARALSVYAFVGVGISVCPSIIHIHLTMNRLVFLWLDRAKRRAQAVDLTLRVIIG